MRCEGARRSGEVVKDAAPLRAREDEMAILEETGRAFNPPPQDECDHGVTFDIEAARQAIRDAGDARARQRAKVSNGVDFILGDVDAVKVIQRRWPRGWFTVEKPK